MSFNEPNPIIAWPQRSDLYIVDGRTSTLGDLSATSGIPFQLLAHRLHLHGGDIVKALDLGPQTVAPVPLKRRRRSNTWRKSLRPKLASRIAFGGRGLPPRLLTFNGETRTIANWSQIFNIGERTLKSRLLYGWSIEQTLTTPIGCMGRRSHADRASVGTDCYIPATCGHPATDPTPGGEEGLSEIIGDRRTVLRSISDQNRVFEG